MTGDDYVKAARNHDWGVLDQAKAAPAGLAAAVERALPRLDEEARRIAVQCVAIRGGPGAGALLLHATGDADVQVASDAAEGLARLAAPPPLDEVLAAIPLRQEGFVRMALYKDVARRPDPGKLPVLERLARAEPDTDAAAWALVAEVRFGSPEARKSFIASVAAAQPDEALAAQERLLFLGDPSLARGLLPWFERHDPVMRLGGDRASTRMARMCDLAVWAAHLAKVPAAPAPPHLDVFGAATVARARAAVAALS